ncbi:hypothetical protein Agabi119p4_1258 [Agaricus bisporus var. burnettii]|uniref:RNA helicase n=1 Tax=Agaricus bisporus var. burnettii TaxID=192524 RepID=A0A8H7KLI8_AGABI|nr:hypothetical protein Agabi119p4_1258 [Agaricus bisporus var. burnettii]
MTLTDAGVLSLNGNKAKKSKSQNKLKSKEMDPAQSDSAAAVLPAEEETPLESQNDEAKRKEEKKKRKKERREKKERDVSAISVDENAMAVDSESQTHPEKKSKKRKRSQDDDMKDTPSEKGDKKKRNKHKGKPDAATPNSEKEKEEGSTQEAYLDSESSRKEKKKDKKKRRHESSDSSAITSVAQTTLTATTATSCASDSEAKAFLQKHKITITTPDDVPTFSPVITFDQLSIPEGLRTAFTGFKEPSPIQACTWPPALDGRDVVGIAETGSGKTLAFGIPALSRLIQSSRKSSKKPSVSILVVAPTRELAIQTHDTLSTLGKPFGIASVAVFGGVPKGPQVEMLKDAAKAKGGMVTRIVVGTPGRILDLVQEGACDLSGVDYLVLDEADRMLDKGFENDIRKIISSTKPMAERQTMMFSATWPEAVRRLASTFQRKPVRVTVGSDDLTANSRVKQIVEVFDDSRSKDQRLLATLRSLSHSKTAKGGSNNSRILVFALYKKEASRVEEMLQRQGYTVCALHGDMSQTARMEMLESFKNGQTNLMVATDVAARGLDIPNVSSVINYTFPLTIEDYIHRIGRTGRGDKSGQSITFFTGDNHERSLAGEFAKVLREGGFDYEALKKFPMTIKKKEHSVYGAFYRDDIPTPSGPTKIVF